MLEVGYATLGSVGGMTCADPRSTGVNVQGPTRQLGKIQLSPPYSSHLFRIRVYISIDFDQRGKRGIGSIVCTPGKRARLLRRDLS